MSQAPNFNDTEYPMGGSKIGPAWQAAWDHLSDGKWHDGHEVVQRMAQVGEILPATAKGLLRQARSHKLIKVEYRRQSGDGVLRRAHAWYRRADRAPAC